MVQAALFAAQEEAAAATAMAAEAQAKLESLSQQLSFQSSRKARVTSSSSRSGSLTSSPNKQRSAARDQFKHYEYAPEFNDADVHSLSETLQSQRQEIATLRQALEEAHEKRNDATRDATRMARMLVHAEKKVRLNAGHSHDIDCSTCSPCAWTICISACSKDCSIPNHRFHQVHSVHAGVHACIPSQGADAAA